MATDRGWEHGSAQRHGWIIFNNINLQYSKPVISPGGGLKPWEGNDHEEILSAHTAREYNAKTFKSSYLAFGRADIPCVVKKKCWGASNPTLVNMQTFARFCRYLVGVPRVVIRHGGQYTTGGHVVFSDANFAGGTTNARSTSGESSKPRKNIIKKPGVPVRNV